MQGTPTFTLGVMASAMLALAGCGSDNHQTDPVTPPSAGLAPDCARMQALTWPNTTFRSATRIETGAASAGSIKLPAHCLVTGEINPRIGVDGVRYGISFELRLPLDWNGRFQFQGGGGTDGNVPPAYGVLNNRPAVAPALSQGTAVVSSDMGHSATDSRDATFGLDPQARIDWGYNALDQVTQLAKFAVASFYGQAPTHSYFVGCSGGGRQGMMMTQRFPHHFDGVVSGAPILEQHVAQVGSMQILQELRAIAPPDAAGNPILSRAFSDAQLQLVADGVQRQCDARDGAADGLIEQYDSCRYDPAELQCGSGASGSAGVCLSPQQVGALTRIFQGPKNSAGAQLYPPIPWDISVSGWRGAMLGTSGTAVPNARRATNQSIRYVFMTPARPDFDYFRFDFDRDPAIMTASAAFTATNGVDYSGFKARQGKTILFMGVSDAVLNANGMNRWYDRLVQANGGAAATGKFARLFNVPGMDHCSGGKALDDFDPVTPLYDWVEKDKVPETILARGASFPGRVRPLCPYPQIARYQGSGSVDDAANFRCGAP